MASKTPKKRNKKYTPPPAHLVRTSTVMFKLSEQAQRNLKDEPFNRLLALLQGRGDYYGLKTVRFRIEYVRVVMDKFKEVDLIETITQKAITKLEDLIWNFRRTNKFEFSFNDYDAVVNALCLADSADEQLMRVDIAKAYDECLRRLHKDPTFGLIA